MKASPLGDVVEWLRGMADYCRKTTTNGYRYDEAADEIERLRAELLPTPGRKTG